LKYENQQIQLEINRLEEQILQLEKELTETIDTAPIEKEIKDRKTKIEALQKSFKNDIELDLVQEIEDGGNFGAFSAIFQSIGELGDKALSLLRDKMEDALKAMQKSLIPAVEEISKAWEEFTGGSVNMNFDNQKTFENFVEKVSRLDKNGNVEESLYFISEIDRNKYEEDKEVFKKKHKPLNDKLSEVFKKIKETSDKAVKAKLQLEKDLIYEKINALVDEFVAKHDKMDNASLTKYLNEKKQLYIDTMGDKQGKFLFKRYLAENFSLSRMRILYNKKLSNEQFQEIILRNLDNFQFVYKPDSKLLKPYSPICSCWYLLSYSHFS